MRRREGKKSYMERKGKLMRGMKIKGRERREKRRGGREK